MLGGRFVSMSEEMPRWYGISYRVFNRRGVMAHRIPINLMVRWLLNLQTWTMGGMCPSWSDKRMQKIYDLGFNHGLAQADHEALDTLRRVEDKLKGVL